MTQIVAVPEAAKSDTSFRILIILFFASFSIFYEFQKTQGSGDSGSDFGAVPELAKSDTSFRILIFFIFCIFWVPRQNWDPRTGPQERNFM